MPERNVNRLLLMVIIGLYVLLGGLFAVRTPAWQTPDEPAHYNYVAQIAQDGRIPTIEMGDWDQAYLDELRAGRFAVPLLDDIDNVQYEDHQPPLYYLLLTPVYALTDGNLDAMRVFSMLLGITIIVGAYGVGGVMFPQRPWLGLGTAAFVAFQPQHLHIIASVNNDVLAWGIVAITLWGTLHYLKSELSKLPVWMLGLMVGIGLITKATTYFMGGVVLLAILFKWRRDERDFRALARAVTLYLVPALALGLLWWGRNIIVYGFPDFLGLAAHDVVVVGQPRTADLIDRVGFGGYLEILFNTSFNSFWGQFGWMGVPMRPWYYLAIQLVLGLALAGLIVDLIGRLRNGEKTSPAQRDAWIILSTVVVLSVLAFVYYNTQFQQHQGRYMFPVLIPLGLWLSLGLDTWRQLILDRLLTGRLAALVPYTVPTAMLALVPFNVWLLWRIIVPNLAP